MSESATILVPVDFSGHSRAAIERACVLAEGCEARLRLLHAMHFSPATIDYAFSEPVWSDLRRSETTALETLSKSFEDRDIEVETVFEERDPTDAIRYAALASDVELIVMGSHGRRGLDRLLLGSVAERTLQDAPVPVVIVREDETEAAQKIGSILFATDFSEDAERAERVVADWALRLGSEVEIFHAIRETAVLFAPYAVPGAADFECEIREAASRRMEGVVERFLKAGVSAKSTIAYGFPAEEIIKRAETTGVQLIAMGKRGYSTLQRFLVGSVAQRVLRHAPCSVLVASSPPSSTTP